MPKFNDNENEIIFSKLKSTGELLFVKHGFKKVSISDITENVGIGKGTFYHFYANKEHLFMDIYNHIQQEIFAGVEQILTVESDGKDKAFRIIKYLVDKFREHPLISMVSSDMYAILKCKVPNECMQQNDMDDFKLLQKVIDAGVVSKYPPNIVIKAVQSVFLAAHAFQDDEDYHEVIDVLIQSIVDSVVV